MGQCRSVVPEASAPAETTKVVNGGAVVLHGFGLAAMAKGRCGRKISRRGPDRRREKHPELAARSLAQ